MLASCNQTSDFCRPKIERGVGRYAFQIVSNYSTCPIVFAEDCMFPWSQSYLMEFGMFDWKSPNRVRVVTLTLGSNRIWVRVTRLIVRAWITHELLKTWKGNSRNHETWIEIRNVTNTTNIIKFITFFFNFAIFSHSSCCLRQSIQGKCCSSLF
jgi:hypothetical protein